jgi:enoyl-CoA hydratase/carnithine racemase
MQLLTLLSFAATTVCAAATNSSASPIVTTKVTPSYWRATFSSPPLNIQNNAWYSALHALIDQITKDDEVKVVVFDSAAPDFYIAHFDVINGVSPDNLQGYWPNMTQLSNSPVLTIAAVRGIARGGGAEFVAALDVSFGSKEKAVMGQFEVGVGKSRALLWNKVGCDLCSQLVSGALPGGGGLAVLPRRVGRNRALEIALGAQDLDAETAALYGC